MRIHILTDMPMLSSSSKNYNTILTSYRKLRLPVRTNYVLSFSSENNLRFLKNTTGHEYHVQGIELADLVSFSKDLRCGIVVVDNYYCDVGKSCDTLELLSIDSALLRVYDSTLSIEKYLNNHRRYLRFATRRIRQ